MCQRYVFMYRVSVMYMYQIDCFILYQYYFIYDQPSWTACHHLDHLSSKIYLSEKYMDFPDQHIDDLLVGQLI